MSYSGRVGHFRFSRENGTLVVTSSRESGFEKTFAWPEDEDIDTEYLHENYYTQVQRDFREFQE